MHIRTLTAFVLLLPALLIACSGDDGEVTPEVDAATLLIRAADRMEQVRSFHFVLRFDGGGSEIVRGLEMERAEGDFAGVDRVQVRTRVRLGSLDADVEIRIVDGQGWITNPLTGRWEREQISLGDLFDLSQGVTALMRSAGEARVTGRERVGDVDTYRVEATLASDDLTLLGGVIGGETLRARAWIGVDDPLVYRVQIDGALFQRGRDGSVHLTLSRHDETVEIVAPR